MKTWCHLKVPVSKRECIFNSLKRRKHRKENRSLLWPGCPGDRAWNVIWVKVKWVSSNCIAHQNSENISQNWYSNVFDTTIKNLRVCMWERRAAHVGAGLASEALSSPGYRSGASCSCDQGREVKPSSHEWPEVSKVLITCTVSYDLFIYFLLVPLGKWLPPWWAEVQCVRESIICSAWLMPWDYKKLQVVLVTRELSVILNYWQIFYVVQSQIAR